MNVQLVAFTPDADTVIASAANLCYSDIGIEEIKNNLTEEKKEKLIRHLFKSGHMTPFEHASFTFGIGGVSRVCTHQLVRHRVASFSQQSQRYVKMNEIDMVVPPSILENEEALKLFNAAVYTSHNMYRKMVEMGISAEDARFVLPHGWETKIVSTMNARELHHFFSLRMCNRAQWEIRELATKMLSLVRPHAPFTFKVAGPSCAVKGYCGEGKGCGNPYPYIGF